MTSQPQLENFEGNEFKQEKRIQLHHYLEILSMTFESMQNIKSGREWSLAVTKLEECLLWLTQDLKLLNESEE